MAIEPDVERVLLRAGGARPGDTVLVAVSGGVDSMVLLHAATRVGSRRGLAIIAAHAHHGLRGEAADRDQQLVESACSRWSVPLRCARLQLADRGSPEDRARRARRRFLAAAAVEVEASLVLLGHHADDQAETVLDRVLAGAGSEGLRGMRPVAPLPEALPHAVRILRPLLAHSRAAILRHADEHQVPYREDASNTDLAFRRNRTRHLLLPFLREAGYPGVTTALGRVAELAGEAADLIEVAAERALDDLVGPLEPALATLFQPRLEATVVLDRSAFRGLAPPLRAPVIRAAVRRLDPLRPPLPGHRAVTGLVHRVLRPGGDAAPWQCRRRLWAVQDSARLILTTTAIRLATLPYPPARLDRDQVCRLAGGAFELLLSGATALSSGAPPATGGDNGCAYLDARLIGLPLWVRPLHAADTLESSSGGRPQRVVRILKRRRVAALDRRVMPVVVAAGSERLIAVPGHLIAPWAAAGAATEDPLALRLETPRNHRG